MKVQHSSATATEVRSYDPPEWLSPRAKAVFRFIADQLTDPLNRSRAGSSIVRATEDRAEFKAAVLACNEAAQAFRLLGSRVHAEHNPGFQSKKHGKNPVNIHESFSIMVLAY